MSSGDVVSVDSIVASMKAAGASEASIAAFLAMAAASGATGQQAAVNTGDGTNSPSSVAGPPEHICPYCSRVIPDKAVRCDACGRG